MAEEKKKRITTKKAKTAKRFAKKLVQHGNKELAADQCGLSRKYGYDIVKQPEFLTALQIVLDEEGLDDLKIAQTIKRGLEAFYVRKDGGIKYPDFHAIDKALSQLIKIKGGYAPEKTEHSEKKVTFIVTPDILKGVKDSRILEHKKIESDIIDAEVLDEIAEEKK